MRDGVRIRVPVGADAERWVTRGRTGQVLFVVHNVTSATRLLDVLPLFDGDLRIQVTATCTGSSPFLAGVPELLAGAGLPVLPWEQAKEAASRFDVVIAASYGGELEFFQGKLVILSHGVGYNKRLAAPGAGSREPGAGSREPGAGSREPEAGSRKPPRLPFSASPRTGSSTTAVPSPRRPSSPTPNSSGACARPARRPLRPPSSRATPATTASSKPCRTGSASGAHSASPRAGGSSSSTPRGRPARSSVTAVAAMGTKAGTGAAPPTCSPGSCRA